MTGRMKSMLYITALLSLVIGFSILPVTAQSLFDDVDGPGGSLVTAQLLNSMTEAAPGQTYQAAVKVTIKPHWHINSNQPNQDYLIPAKLTVENTDQLTVNNIRYPDAATVFLLNEEMSVYDGEFYVSFDYQIDKNFTGNNISLTASFAYQPCNDSECRAPADLPLSMGIPVGSGGSAINAEIFADVPKGTINKETTNDAGATPVQPDSKIAELITTYGFWGYFLALGLAFVVGLSLSFSPCTYPMIPITISIFAGQDRSMGKGFILSLFYVGSMAVVYGIMGLVVSLIGGVFGAWLANPAVVIGIAILFVLFALSMFGLYEIQVPMALRNKLGGAKGGGGVGSVILLGIVAALVVSPCVGPFVMGILVFIATEGNPVFGFFSLFIFAFGLGTLYILLGTFSNAINKLPKAGEWMDQVKKFFGFILLLMALYFLQPIVDEMLIVTLTALLLIVFAVFGGCLDRLTPESPFFARLKKLLGVLAFIAGLYLLLGSMLMNGFILPKASAWLPSGGGSTVIEDKINWQTDLTRGLEEAKSSGKPVLIDTWATWCVNCKVLEKETFGNPEVIKESKRFASLKIQLETQNDPATIQFMERFNLKTYTLPTVLLLDAEGSVKKILTGVVPVDDMLAEMRKL